MGLMLISVYYWVNNGFSYTWERRGTRKHDGMKSCPVGKPLFLSFLTGAIQTWLTSYTPLSQITLMAGASCSRMMLHAMPWSKNGFRSTAVSSKSRLGLHLSRRQSIWASVRGSGKRSPVHGGPIYKTFDKGIKHLIKPKQSDWYKMAQQSLRVHAKMV